MNIQKILLPIDDSEHAAKAIAYAADVAQLVQAQIVVMHAFNPPITLRKRGSIMVDEFKNSLEMEAQELIQETAESLQALGVAVTSLAVEGAPAEAILRAIEDEQPDLVVMGSRGAGGWPGVRLGSVAERVVRHSTVPVLVVK